MAESNMTCVTVLLLVLVFLVGIDIWMRAKNDDFQWVFGNGLDLQLHSNYTGVYAISVTKAPTHSSNPGTIEGSNLATSPLTTSPPSTGQTLPSSAPTAPSQQNTVLSTTSLPSHAPTKILTSSPTRSPTKPLSESPTGAPFSVDTYADFTLQSNAIALEYHAAKGGNGTERLFTDAKLLPDFVNQQTEVPYDKALENERNCVPRICYERKNIIEYTYKNHAGLDDRRSVITTLSNIAASLCARLVFKPPCQVLSHGKVSCDMKWSNVYRLTYKYGPLADKTVFLGGIMPIDQTYDDSFTGNGYKGYQSAFESLSQNRTFHWKITSNIYRVRKSIVHGLFPHGQESALNNSKPFIYHKYKFGCIYIKLQYSLELFKKAEDLLNQLQLRPHNYAAVHIRRGDLKKQCRSDPENMEFYFNCWHEFGNNTNYTMLLFTDEQDPQYLSDIQGVAKKHGIALRTDTESTLDSMFTDGFKVLVYPASQIVRTLAFANFELRRSKQCKEKACSPLWYRR